MEMEADINFSVINVISFRGRVSPAETRRALKSLNAYIAANGAEKSGPMITAAYSIEEGVTASDAGIYIPIDKEISSNNDFVFMPVFNITDCIMVKYKGYPHLVLYAGLQLLERAGARGCNVGPPLYNVYVNTPPGRGDINKFEVDIYAKKGGNGLH